MDIKHIYQPNGYSCGPTCIKMVSGIGHSVEMISEMCGTDNVVGTPPERMRKGFDTLGVNYSEYISMADPYGSLKNSIDSGNYCILRTLIVKIPHWIICVGYDGDMFKIFDPAAGIYELEYSGLEKIWSPRDYFYFEILKK